MLKYICFIEQMLYVCCYLYIEVGINYDIISSTCIIWKSASISSHQIPDKSIGWKDEVMGGG